MFRCVFENKEIVSGRKNYGIYFCQLDLKNKVFCGIYFSELAISLRNYGIYFCEFKAQTIILSKYFFDLSNLFFLHLKTFLSSIPWGEIRRLIEIAELIFANLPFKVYNCGIHFCESA